MKPGYRFGKVSSKKTPVKPVTKASTLTLLFVGVACLGLIVFFYRSASVTVSAEDLANILSHAQDTVIEDAKNRTYVNLILFLQAGIGLTFIVLPFAIAMYRNRAVLKRLNRRVESYHHRQKGSILIRETVVETDPEEVFFKQLLEVHPELTPYELKLCSLLRQNNSSKEIAEELNITPGSVNTARYRLRKKLAIDKEADLIIYLNKIA